MAKDLGFCVLLDLYGGMISEKQYESMDYYYNQDLSLAEIGEIQGISRQAVRNNIKSGEENILAVESKLGLSKKAEELKRKISSVVSRMEDLNTEINNDKLAEYIKELAGIELI